jgi:O-antigen/teichoic acid export membrane protein
VAARDVVLVAEAQLVLTAIAMVVMLVAIRLRARDYLFPLRPGRRGAAELVAFGAKSAAGHASFIAVANVDKIGLAAILPVAVLPTYSIPFSVALRITLVSSAQSIVLLPRMAAISSLGDSEEARRLGLTALRVIALASATLATCFVFAGGAFLELWVNPGFADDAWGPLIALSIGFGALATGSVARTLLDASGRPGLNVALTATGAVVALSLGLGLVAIFETALGAAVGAAAGLSLIGTGALELARRVALGTSRRRLLQVVAVPWLTLSAAGALAFLASAAIAASPVITILCVASAATGALVFAELRQGALRGDAGH